MCIVVNLIFATHTHTCSSTWLGLSSEQDGPLVLHVGSRGRWCTRCTGHTSRPYRLCHSSCWNLLRSNPSQWLLAACMICAILPKIDHAIKQLTPPLYTSLTIWLSLWFPSPSDRSAVRLPTPCNARVFAYSINHSFIHLFIYSLTHSLTHSHHSLTRSFTAANKARQSGACVCGFHNDTVSVCATELLHHDLAISQSTSRKALLSQTLTSSSY